VRGSADFLSPNRDFLRFARSRALFLVVVSFGAAPAVIPFLALFSLAGDVVAFSFSFQGSVKLQIVTNDAVTFSRISCEVFRDIPHSLNAFQVLRSLLPRRPLFFPSFSLVDRRKTFVLPTSRPVWDFE